MSKRRLKIFISYARSDQAKAYGLYKRLIGDGLDAWIDQENLLPGQDWELEIRKFIRKADVVVVCLSKKFNKAGFRQKEVRLALDMALEKPEGEIFIIPVRLEKCENLENLRKWNWVDLFGDSGYENLIRALHQRANEINAAVPQLSMQGNSQAVRSNVAKKKSTSKPKKVSKIETSGGSVSGNETKLEILARNEKLVSDRVLKNWLNGHGLTENPFGKVDLRSYPYYPMGSMSLSQ